MITDILRAGSVTRYHNTIMRDKQNLDAHSWEVAVILKHIYPSAHIDMVMAALYHDLGEAFTGDVPAPMKRSNQRVKNIFDNAEKKYTESIGIETASLTEVEHLALKYADVLSGIWHTHKAYLQGDKYAEKVRNTFIEYLNALPYLNEHTNPVLFEILGE